MLLVRGPIHYDFLLPLDAQTREHFAFLRADGFDLDHQQAQWLVMGWGGRDFYTTTGTYRDVNARAVWRGVTGDASVMRVDLAGDLPTDLRSRPLNMTAAQYTALVDAIANSFDGSPAIAINGYNDFDSFYPARGRFDITRTCNDWVGRMIRAAGLRFGVWTPMAASVSLSYWLYQT